MSLGRTVFPRRLEGRVVLRGDARPDVARQVDNAAIDRHPAAIASARDAEEVRATLALAQASGTALSVRGGSHSTPGLGVADDAIVLDMTGLRAIEIDAASGTAWIESGVTAGEATATLHRAGFAIPLGDSGTVGVGGLTLSGGIGWLVRRHDMTIDSLLAAEVRIRWGASVSGAGTRCAQVRARRGSPASGRCQQLVGVFLERPGHTGQWFHKSGRAGFSATDRERGRIPKTLLHQDPGRVAVW